jgi:hypothetical protein
MATVDEIRRVKTEFGNTIVPEFDEDCYTVVHRAFERMIEEVREREQRAEIESFGADALTAAEAGWEALRARNPKVDREDGAGNEARVFGDLPHKVKLNYLTFAHGALYSNVPQRFVAGASLSVAPLGTALPTDPFAPLVGFRDVGIVESVEVAEPVRFEKDDRMKVTGPAVMFHDKASPFSVGDVVTLVSGYVDPDGDVRAYAGDDRDDWHYIRASSLTKIEEPATEEPVFKPGDRVRIVGPHVTVTGGPQLVDGEYGTVVGFKFEGNVHLTDHRGVSCYLDPASLELANDPRTWDTLESIPADVHKVKDCTGDLVTRNSSREIGWECTCNGRAHDADNICNPFTEVISD